MLFVFFSLALAWNQRAGEFCALQSSCLGTWHQHPCLHLEQCPLRSLAHVMQWLAKIRQHSSSPQLWDGVHLSGSPQTHWPHQIQWVLRWASHPTHPSPAWAAVTPCYQPVSPSLPATLLGLGCASGREEGGWVERDGGWTKEQSWETPPSPVWKAVWERSLQMDKYNKLVRFFWSKKSWLSSCYK